MNSLSFAHAKGIAGRYCTDKGQWAVTLRPIGENYEIVSLEVAAGSAVAEACDMDVFAAEFTVPRAGVDRYPDWAAYEWDTRLIEAHRYRRDVWRIAEDNDCVTFLGMAVPQQPDTPLLPLAAALWRGWSRQRAPGRRALFWNSNHGGHLWVLQPFGAPRYVRLGKQPSAEEVVLAVGMIDDPERVVLEVGGVGLDFWRELTVTYPGRTCQTEPFSDFAVDPSLRERILSAPDPTLYLPALGAARAFAEGAPSVLTICESSPEHSADAV